MHQTNKLVLRRSETAACKHQLRSSDAFATSSYAIKQNPYHSACWKTVNLKKVKQHNAAIFEAAGRHQKCHSQSSNVCCSHQVKEEQGDHEEKTSNTDMHNVTGPIMETRLIAASASYWLTPGYNAFTCYFPTNAVNSHDRPFTAGL